MTENSGLELRSLGFSWTSSCLSGGLPSTDTTGSVAQLLTLHIDSVDGKPLEDPVGFRLSFRHLPIPQLLRLSALLNDTQDSELLDDWRDPPAHLRIDLSELVDNLHTQVDSSREHEFVEHEIEELRVLQSQIRELRGIVRTKEKVISDHLGKDVFSLKERIDQCDSIGCVLQAIVHKAHGAIKVMYVRLRHGQTHNQHAFTSANFDGHWNETRASEEPPPNGSEHGSKPRLSKGIIIALGAIAAVLGCGCIFLALRGCCCSPRRKVDRLAQREERRTAQAYKKAARRQRWRDWWYGRDPRIADYEEKRALIMDQEGLLEEAMQEEIRQLRNAHEVVDGIVRAEGGRYSQSQAGMHTHLTSQNSSRRSSNASDRFSQPLSRTSSLPSYTTEPGSAGLPGYEEHSDDTSTVANGFPQYTPSSSSDPNWTPGSSIIDVSPRQSIETMRTKYEDHEVDDDDEEHRDGEQQDH